MKHKESWNLSYHCDEIGLWALNCKINKQLVKKGYSINLNGTENSQEKVCMKRCAFHKGLVIVEKISEEANSDQSHPEIACEYMTVLHLQT